MGKIFTAPFWFLMILGIVSIGISIYAIYALEMLAPGSPVNMNFRILSFCWPAVIFLEGMVYWIIRKRNKYRRASWTHIVLFTIGFFSPLLKELLFIFYDNFITGPGVATFVRFGDLAQTCIFWACMIVGHGYFGWLLVKCYTEGPPAEEGRTDGINILDDVLS